MSFDDNSSVLLILTDTRTICVHDITFEPSLCHVEDVMHRQHHVIRIITKHMQWKFYCMNILKRKGDIVEFIAVNLQVL